MKKQKNSLKKSKLSLQKETLKNLQGMENIQGGFTTIFLVSYYSKCPIFCDIKPPAPVPDDTTPKPVASVGGWGCQSNETMTGCKPK